MIVRMVIDVLVVDTNLMSRELHVSRIEESVFVKFVALFAVTFF